MQVLHVGDEEDDEWVREQIRRGARGAAPMAQPAAPAPSRPAPPGPGAATSATLAQEIGQSGDRVLQSLQQAFNRLKVTVSNAPELFRFCRWCAAYGRISACLGSLATPDVTRGGWEGKMKRGEAESYGGGVSV